MTTMKPAVREAMGRFHAAKAGVSTAMHTGTTGPDAAGHVETRLYAYQAAVRTLLVYRLADMLRYRGDKLGRISRRAFYAAARALEETEGIDGADEELTGRDAVRAAAYRQAADLAEDVAIRLHSAHEIERENGAMEVAAALRDKAGEIHPTGAR